jgi:hypothetical protein
MPEDNLPVILAEFNIPQLDYELCPVKHGLINKSYVVIEKSTNKKAYFLQQVDHNVFNDIEGIMHNIGVVSDHFKSDPDAPAHLSTQPTSSGANFFRSKVGEYWRLYDYVKGNTYYRANDKHIAAEAGRMFGEFENALQGIDISFVQNTIPGFHDIDLRYEQFKESLLKATSTRINKAKPLIDIVKEQINYVKDIYHDTVNTCLPRVTHNDTKLSNLLFNDNKKGICVVDYDTLMPGYLPLDFGDSVRTICSTTVEDDTDLKGTFFDLNIYRAFTSNFIEALEGAITKTELSMLPRTVAYMPFLMGLRMLTDYLNNDIYYTTQYEQHNFDRAANQLTLFMSGVELLNEMNNIVLEINN